MDRRAGMTLVELLVVLLVVGVLLSVSTAAFGPQLLGPASATEVVAEPLARARMNAARRGEVVRVVLSADGSYVVEAVGDRASLSEGTIPIEGIEPAPFRVTIFPAGTASGGQLRIRWQGRWHAMHVDPVTARVIATPRGP